MPDPRSATVTFLVTDIAGFTRLWEEHPDAMGEALARHDALLRHAIGGAGGSIFKTAGDGFYAAFATAPAATAAAVHAQSLLQAESWRETGPLQVRMALHTGVAEHREGDYFGSTVNRVTFLLRAGHGGQVLVSQATQELIRDRLPEGAALRDLGEHRLHDLLHREHIFQLVIPGLTASFPPLKTLDRLETPRRLRLLSQEILLRLDRDATLAQLTCELPAAFPAKSATLFMLDPMTGIYRQQDAASDAVTLSLRESLLLHYLQEAGRPVRTDDPNVSPPEVTLLPQEWEMARSLGAVLWLPLMLQGRLIGALALGEKASGEVYTEEEAEELCLITSEAAVALEMATLSAAREEQARLQQEVAIARLIQRRLLPPPRLVLKGYEVLSRTEPSTEVGGDFYNVFALTHGGGGTGPDPEGQPARLGVLVGDVAGKGVAAALFMAVTTTLIEGQAQLVPSPAATLAAANAALYPKMRQPGGEHPVFATAVYGVLDMEQGEMRLANAGQTPPIYWPVSGEPRYVRLKGLPLGALPTASYDETVIRLAHGDRLMLCSDGFVEETDAAGKQVGYQGFLQRLVALGDRSGSELIGVLFDTGSPTRGGALDSDDRTLVLITVSQSTLRSRRSSTSDRARRP
jgi:serine phosphatase RsbU (regulator of sigma subunit)/class 3 adenylate cyclase